MAVGPTLVQRGLLLVGGLTAILAIVGIVFWAPRGQSGPSADAAAPAKETSAPGWMIRYNATATLARRGSPNVSLETLCEILDESQQMRNFRAKLPNGQELADEAAARSTLIVGLKAFAEWHQHPEAVKSVRVDNPQLLKVYETVDKLAQNGNVAVRKEAEATQSAYRKSKV